MQILIDGEKIKVKNKSTKKHITVDQNDEKTTITSTPRSLKMKDKSEVDKEEKEKAIELDRVIKEDDEHQVIDAVAIEPNKEDAHGDEFSKEQARKAQMFHFRNSQFIGDNHEEPNNSELVGSITLADDVTRWEGKEVNPGSWIVSVHIPDENRWEKAKKGKLTGISPGGFLIREPTPEEERVQPD